jgi:O-6-methylguanine DNA methyltransferase
VYVGDWDRLTTPLGTLTIFLDREGRLVELDLTGREGPRPATGRLCTGVPDQLLEYFAGKRRDFDFPLAPQGSPFQRRVWYVLRSIPHGEAWSYADVARRLGMPGAARAVGHANGANPIPIVIPCHRVVASDGSIGGYSGGLEVKRRLLALEGIRLAA